MGLKEEADHDCGKPQWSEQGNTQGLFESPAPATLGRVQAEMIERPASELSNRNFRLAVACICLEAF